MELLLPEVKRQVLKEFREIVYSHTIFKGIFFALFVCEAIGFFLFLSKTSILIFFLSSMILTAFIFWILLHYNQSRKAEALSEVKERFIDSCKRRISLPEGAAEHHLALSQALLSLNGSLEKFEIKLPYPFMKKILSRFHREDVFFLKELLLEAAANEHLILLRSIPTDIEVHASLANLYIISSCFFHEKKDDKRFREKANLAVEELKILEDFAPNDPWVHARLAHCYHILFMKEEERKEYEILIRLKPDAEVIFCLGKLSFELGRASSGLKCYEKLLSENRQKAEELLSYYGPFKP